MTTGERIAAVASAVLERPPAAAGREGRQLALALRAVRSAHRFGLLRPVLELFPPLEAEQEWRDLLGLFAGVALALGEPDQAWVDDWNVQGYVDEGRSLLTGILGDG